MLICSYASSLYKSLFLFLSFLLSHLLLFYTLCASIKCLSILLFSFNSENSYPKVHLCIFLLPVLTEIGKHTYYLSVDAVECTFHRNVSLESTELSSALSSQGSCCETVSVVACYRYSLEITTW